MKFDSSNWQGQGWDGLQAWLAPGTQPLLFKHYLAILALMCFLVLSHSLSTVNRFPAYINRWLQIVLLPGKSHGRRSLVGCSPWGCKESDTTEVTSLSLFTFMHWRRKWQPTLVFLPGESQGWGSLVGCRLWGCTELDMTEAT